MTSRSTARPLSSAPAIERPSSRSAGVTTTSQSRLTPRATASTGSKLRVRSNQATIEPAVCAWATARRASVVLPLEPSPRRPTQVDRGSPPLPRIASSVSKPVEMTPWAGVRCGSGSPASSSANGTVASAPTTSPTCRGAAAPQRDRRVASAAVTSGDRVAMRLGIIEHLFYLVKSSSSLPRTRARSRFLPARATASVAVAHQARRPRPAPRPPVRTSSPGRRATSRPPRARSRS
jgi:hypothetical protein